MNKYFEKLSSKQVPRSEPKPGRIHNSVQNSNKKLDSKNWYQKLKLKKKKDKADLKRNEGWQATSNWEHSYSNELLFKPGPFSKLDWDNSYENSVNSVVYAEQNHRLLYFLATLSSTLIIICIIFSILFYAVSERRVPRCNDDTEDDSSDEIEESVISRENRDKTKELERIPAVSNDIHIACSSVSSGGYAVEYDAHKRQVNNSGKRKWFQTAARKLVEFFYLRKCDTGTSMTRDDHSMISLATMSAESSLVREESLYDVQDIAQDDVVYLDFI